MPTKREKAAQIHQSVFTGRQVEIDLFGSLLPVDRPASANIDILVIYGIGGIGKSELLKQFQRVAAEIGTAVAKIEPQAQAGIFDFLLAVYEQLKGQVRFTRFEEGLDRHRKVEAKLLGHASASDSALKMFAKGTHTTLKLVPGVNVFAEVISPEQVEAAVDAVYAAVGRKEGEFWLRPEEEMTDRLLDDLNQYCSLTRLVLMVDTYELMGVFDDWVRDRLFANLGDHGMLVVAGRHRLEGKGWQEYADLMRQVELSPLSESEVQSYLQKKGVTDRQVAAEMVDYADGHPLTLSMLTELAGHVQLKAGDLERVPERRHVIHELLGRITQNVAENLRAALECCAVLRFVTEDSLAYLMQLPDVSRIFEEVRRYDFIKVRVDGTGIALHDVVWTAMNDELRWRSPERYCALQERAATYYEARLEKATGQEIQRLSLERLYHRVRADEDAGIKVFQPMAEELVRGRLLNRLRALLGDVDTYDLQSGDSRLWLEYYHARLAHLVGHIAEAEGVYQRIGECETAAQKLRGYALCDWGMILATWERLGQAGAAEQAIQIINHAMSLIPQTDAKHADGLLALVRIGHFRGDLGNVFEQLGKARDLLLECQDHYGATLANTELKAIYGFQGDWKKMLETHDSVIDSVSKLNNPVFLRARALGGFAYGWALCGRYGEGERNAHEALALADQLGTTEDWPGLLRDLTLILGLQGRYDEAAEYYERFMALMKSAETNNLRGLVTMRAFWGMILLRQGNIQEAQEEFVQSLDLAQRLADNTSWPRTLAWLGILHEIEQNPESAERCYHQALDYRWIGRDYFTSTALTGLVRVKHAKSSYLAIPQLFAEAELLAQQHEYNDHLASIRLTQGHLAWLSSLEAWGTGYEAGLSFYKLALIHALRYNRFLLDELLAGRPQATPLRPIIPHCLAQREEGQRMLVSLAEWWRDGNNDIGMPCPKAVSPLPEGIPLLNAEHMAREREPGDGSPQWSVIEQIEAALAGVSPTIT